MQLLKMIEKRNENMPKIKYIMVVAKMNKKLTIQDIAITVRQQFYHLKDMIDSYVIFLASHTIYMKLQMLDCLPMTTLKAKERETNA